MGRRSILTGVPLGLAGLASLTISLSAFAGPAASAPKASAVLRDVKAGASILLLYDRDRRETLYARAADRQFVPASVVKAMTALVVLDAVKAGEVRLDQKVTVPAALVARWKKWPRASSMRLRAGEKVTLGELLGGTLTASGNDAAELLAESVGGSGSAFIARMNRRATAIGMTSSRFGTVTGWPDGGKTQVTARDLVRLAETILRDHPAAYVRYFGVRQLERGGGALLRNRNPLLGRVAGADGLKTGHISTAGYTLLGSARRGGRRLIVVVAGAQSEGQRAHDAAFLLEAGFAAMDAGSDKKSAPK
jgi:serine-type D-Ala-D-Ala carboxypeptidase (penicillin-binding protein 5/6)